MPSDELVTVFVDRKHLAKVYGFIATLESTVDSAAAPKVQTSSDFANDEWTPSRLRKMLQQSPPAMKDLLRTMASHPGHWLTTRELAAAIQGNDDADWKTVAGTMGAFGRRVKNRYAIESFPFEKKYDHVAKSQAYRMSQEISQIVVNILGEA